MLEQEISQERFIRIKLNQCEHRNYIKGSRYFICEDCGNDFKTKEELDRI